MRLPVRRRCTASQLTDTAQLQADLAEARAEILRLNMCLSREMTAANVADQALAEFRQGIRAAHSSLIADNNRLRRLLERAGVLTA